MLKNKNRRFESAPRGGDIAQFVHSSASGTSAGSPRRPQAPATEPGGGRDPAAMQRSNISQRARALGWTPLDPPSRSCPAGPTRRRPLFSMTLR